MLRASPVLLLLVVAGVVATTAGASRDRSQAVAQQRALTTYVVMQRYFYLPANQAYEGIYPNKGHAQVWPYSQVLSATIELARLPGVGTGALDALPGRISALSAYADRSAGGIGYAAVFNGRGDVFYDDNDWIGLALVDAADLMHSEATLAAARQVFTLIESGWDSNSRDPCPGGIFWFRSPRNHDRTAVSTANAALLAALLYQRTHALRFLTWARRAFNWSQKCLGTHDGLVADHIDATGAVNPRTWSYNQGAMLAAAVNLYRATGDHRYLDDAEQTADAALAILRDPLNAGEPASFLGIFYCDLLQLATVDRMRDDRGVVESFADAAWAQERDPRTGLFYFGHTDATLLDQAAMIQVYAALAST